MLYVALANVAAVIVVTLSFTNIVRWLVRQHARERELLVNQVCHLSGRTWAPAPQEEREEPMPALAELVADPENFPDY